MYESKSRSLRYFRLYCLIGISLCLIILSLNQANLKNFYLANGQSEITPLECEQPSQNANLCYISEEGVFSQSLNSVISDNPSSTPPIIESSSSLSSSEIVISSSSTPEVVEEISSSVISSIETETVTSKESSEYTFSTFKPTDPSVLIKKKENSTSTEKQIQSETAQSKVDSESSSLKSDINEQIVVENSNVTSYNTFTSKSLSEIDATGDKNISSDTNYIDSDGDGVPDIVEVQENTNPEDYLNFKDSDNGGVPDYVETIARPIFNLKISNSQNPNDDKLDEDFDGLFDYFEIYRTKTNPFNSDSDSTVTITDKEDNNQIKDSLEDLDKDGIDNLTEQQNKLDPLNPDSNQDGILDNTQYNQINEEKLELKLISGCSPVIQVNTKNTTTNFDTKKRLLYIYDKQKINQIISNDYLISDNFSFDLNDAELYNKSQKIKAVFLSFYDLENPQVYLQSLNADYYKTPCPSESINYSSTFIASLIFIIFSLLISIHRWIKLRNKSKIL
jgi:hypothetical protein